ncbi:MAG: O-antigen ligase family protein [Sulfobacillus sp.]
MIGALGRLIEESTIVQMLETALTRLADAVGDSAAARVAGRIQDACRRSLLLPALVFTPPSWASWTDSSRLVGALGQRFKLRPEGDQHGTLPVKIAIWFLVLFVPISLYVAVYLPSVTLLSDGVLLAAAIILLIETKAKGWAFRATPLDLPIAVFILVALVSAVLNGESAKIWVLGMRAYLEFAVLYYVVSAAPLTAGDRRQIFQGLLLWGVLMAFIGVAQHFLHIATPAAWTEAISAAQGITTRVPGTMGNPNTYAGYLVLLVAMFAAVASEKVPLWLRTLAIAGLLLGLGATLFTYSREALLALAGAGLVIGLVGDRRLLVAVVGLGLLAMLADPKVIQHLAFGFSSTYSQVSLSYGRLYFWLKSLPLIASHPFFGVGPGLFGGSVAYDFHSLVELRYGLESMSTVDSQWIQLAAETGILGVLAILWVLIGMIKMAVTVFHRDADPLWRALALGTAAGTVGFIIQAIFAGLLEVHQVVVVLWLAAGLTAWRWRQQEMAQKAQRPA